MNNTDGVSTFFHYFNDIIGMVLPGLIFLCGLGFLQAYDLQLLKDKLAPYDWLAWFFAIGISYTLGHVFLGIHKVVSKCSKKVVSKWTNGKTNASPSFSSPSYCAFKGIAENELQKKGQGSQSLSDHDIRSVAMSVSTIAAELGRRFMFLSLFCNGTATSLLALFIWSLSCGPYNDVGVWAARAGLALGALVLLYRGEEFEARALRVPFPVALSSILFRK